MLWFLDVFKIKLFISSIKIVNNNWHEDRFLRARIEYKRYFWVIFYFLSYVTILKYLLEEMGKVIAFGLQTEPEMVLFQSDFGNFHELVSAAAFVTKHWIIGALLNFLGQKNFMTQINLKSRCGGKKWAVKLSFWPCCQRKVALRETDFSK